MPSFEESLKKLESIVEQLRRAIWCSRFAQALRAGLNLSAACKQELEAAEGKCRFW